MGKVRTFMLRQKFRFDTGYQFMMLINFALLVIAASDKLQAWLGIRSTWALVLLLGVGAFGAVWVFGYWLDRVVQYAQGYNVENAKRMPWLEDQMTILRRLDARMRGCMYCGVEEGAVHNVCCTRPMR